MPRGRKIVEEDEDAHLDLFKPVGAEETIADYMSRTCGIPGCVAKLHFENARALIQILKKNGYIIKEGN